MILKRYLGDYVVNITFQHAEPPNDQICHVSFKFYQLHRYYGKSQIGYCLLNSVPMVRHYALLYGFHTLPNMLIKPLREAQGPITHFDRFAPISTTSKTMWTHMQS